MTDAGQKFKDAAELYHALRRIRVHLSECGKHHAGAGDTAKATVYYYVLGLIQGAMDEYET